jgi:hypothetical protein
MSSPGGEETGEGGLGSNFGRDDALRRPQGPLRLLPQVRQARLFALTGQGWVKVSQARSRPVKQFGKKNCTASPTPAIFRIRPIRPICPILRHGPKFTSISTTLRYAMLPFVILCYPILTPSIFSGGTCDPASCLGDLVVWVAALRTRPQGASVANSYVQFALPPAKLFVR